MSGLTPSETPSRFVTGTRLRLAEFVRRPTTLALLVGLPPVVIEVYGAALGSFPGLPALETNPTTAGRLTGTLFAVAFLAGLIGLFQVVSARDGDGRLALCGFPRTTLLATRLVTVLAVATLGAIVAVGVLAWHVAVAAPLLAFAALVLAGLVYGLLGVIVGALVPRDLEGSLVLVFLADLDNVLSSGLFAIDATVPVPGLGTIGVAHLVPLYHPHALFETAVLDGSLAADAVVPALASLGVLFVLAVLAYVRSTGAVGG